MVRLRVGAVAKEKGVSKSKLSRDSDLSLWTIRALWNPDYNASIKTLAIVARALEVRVCDLIEEGDEEEESGRKRRR